MEPKKHAHHYETHHYGTEELPYDALIGITSDGVPVMSNGNECFFSNEESPSPGSVPLCQFDAAHPNTALPAAVGYKWQCVEFVRRYLASRKAVWLASVPTAEDLWVTQSPFTSLVDGSPVGFRRCTNGSISPRPDWGDIVVWATGPETPFGHVAIVTEVCEGKIRVAEQNQGFERWPEGVSYSRELPMIFHSDCSVELTDEDPLLGWISVDAPFYSFDNGNLADYFRIITGPGTIVRKPVERRVDLPWINTCNRCDFFLKRSLTIGGVVEPGACAEEADVPSAFYYLDYNMWCRINRAATSLHAIAMEATARVLDDPDATHILEHYFGVPPEIHPLIRYSWEHTPAMGGRFDFGYDGEHIVMLEYNCDSSGALLECCDTQAKMADSYGVTLGKSTGSFLAAKCVDYFKNLLNNEKACPKHRIIHFMIDNDDEERYTALCMMQFAEQTGFTCKLCVGLVDFRYVEGSPTNAAPQALPCGDHPTIVDADGDEVLLVWKTWSWDTVLSQYNKQKLLEKQPEAPTLSDILLNNHIRVLEPLWKCITGSKAILPFMHQLAGRHENMLPASFFRTAEIIAHHYISKPVNGRAGQNVTMYDPVTDPNELAQAEEEGLGIMAAAVEAYTGSGGSFAANQSFDKENESSAGKFFDSVLVYQRRLFLKKFENKFFPIFCGWMVGNEFGGVVVREDTSKITKLCSVVVPSRVVRENVSLTQDKEATTTSNSSAK